MPFLEAALYARVSGEQQADAQTIQSQIAALRERIAFDEVLVPPDREFIDDGYSGATLVRPALERLRGFAAAAAIKTDLCPFAGPIGAQDYGTLPPWEASRCPNGQRWCDVLCSLRIPLHQFAGGRWRRPIRADSGASTGGASDLHVGWT